MAKKETKIIEKSTYGIPFVLVSIALVALLGFTTKGYTDWTFGLNQSEETSITSSDNLSSSSSEEETPGTSSETPATSEDPVTSEDPISSEDSGTSEDSTTSSDEAEELEQFTSYTFSYNDEAEELETYLNIDESIKYTLDYSNVSGSGGTIEVAASGYLKITFENLTFNKITLSNVNSQIGSATINGTSISMTNYDSSTGYGDGVVTLSESTNEFYFVANDMTGASWNIITLTTEVAEETAEVNASINTTSDEEENDSYNGVEIIEDVPSIDKIACWGGLH